VSARARPAVQPDRRVEPQRGAISGVLTREQAVGNRKMEVRVGIQAGAEAVQEGHGAEAGIGR